MTLAEIEAMTKPKGRPKTGRNDLTAKLDAQVLRWAQVVAKSRGVTTAEYLTELLRVPVVKDFNKLMEQMKKEGTP